MSQILEWLLVNPAGQVHNPIALSKGVLELWYGFLAETLNHVTQAFPLIFFSRNGQATVVYIGASAPAIPYKIADEEEILILPHVGDEKVKIGKVARKEGRLSHKIFEPS